MKKTTILCQGISLVEVTLALGVASVCLTMIFSLLPVGLRASQNATQQGSAADILAAVIVDLRTTAAAIPTGEATTSRQFAINIPPRPITNATISTVFFSGDGQPSASANPQSRYRLTINFLPNPNTRAATLVDLNATWPAEAASSSAIGSAEMFLSLDN